MNVVILGSGRTGAELATSLTGNGDRVSVIEKDPRHVIHLPEQLVNEGKIDLVRGDGSVTITLQRAGIEEAELFIALAGKDTLNGLVAQKVRQLFKVKRVIARVRDLALADLYDSLGIEVYCPTRASVDYVVSSLSGDQTDIA